MQEASFILIGIVVAVLVLIVAQIIRSRMPKKVESIPVQEYGLSEQNAWWIIERLVLEKCSAFWGKDGNLYIMKSYSSKGAEWVTFAKFWVKDNELGGEELKQDQRRIVETIDKGKLSARIAAMYKGEADKKHTDHMKRVGRYSKEPYPFPSEPKWDDWENFTEGYGR